MLKLKYYFIVYITKISDDCNKICFNELKIQVLI